MSKERQLPPKQPRITYQNQGDPNHRGCMSARGLLSEISADEFSADPDKTNEGCFKAVKKITGKNTAKFRW